HAAAQPSEVALRSAGVVASMPSVWRTRSSSCSWVQLCSAGGSCSTVPHFRHPCAGPAGLQAVRPAHIRALVGADHECEAPTARGLRDHDRRGPRALAGPIMAEEAIAHLAAAATLPLAADVLGAPLPHAREIGDEVVDGFRGRVDLDTGFPMHAMDSHERAPR